MRALVPYPLSIHPLDANKYLFLTAASEYLLNWGVTTTTSNAGVHRANWALDLRLDVPLTSTAQYTGLALNFAAIPIWSVFVNNCR